MDDVSAKRWWKEKGAKTVNERTIDLIGHNIGYMPIENLFTEEELRELDEDTLFSLIDTMCEDGMKVKELIYANGSRALHFFID